MINSISGTLVAALAGSRALEKQRIFIFYKSEGGRRAAGEIRYRQIFHFAAVAFRAPIRLNTLSPRSHPRCDVTRPSDSAREQTINLIIAAHDRAIGERVHALVYLCTRACTRRRVAFFPLFFFLFPFFFLSVLRERH